VGYPLLLLISSGRGVTPDDGVQHQQRANIPDRSAASSSGDRTRAGCRGLGRVALHNTDSKAEHRVTGAEPGEESTPIRPFGLSGFGLGLLLLNKEVRCCADAQFVHLRGEQQNRSLHLLLKCWNHGENISDSFTMGSVHGRSNRAVTV
jgi:hypothetical protein